MGREVRGGSGWGDTCAPMGDSCRCMAKTTQYCKEITLQLKLLINFLKKKNLILPREESIKMEFHLGFQMRQDITDSFTGTLVSASSSSGY